MASPVQEVQNLLSFLDAIMACIENYPTFNLNVPTITVGASVSPIGLLLMLLGKFCTEEELIEWLAKYIIYVLPVLEVVIKGVILSNLKLGNSCNVDPWIPDEWRQHNDNMNKDADKDANEDDSCVIPVSLIDYRNILQINPTSKIGKEYYFNASIEYRHGGVGEDEAIVGNSYNEVYEQVAARAAYADLMPQEEQEEDDETDNDTEDFYSEENIEFTGDITTVYELARADDMNAFLWFTMNKGQYVNINYTDLSKNVKDAVRISTICQDLDGSYSIDDTPNNTEIYISGDIVSTKTKNNTSTNYMICYDGGEEANLESGSVSYYSHLCPCSNRVNSYNWYVNRNNYFNKNLGVKGTEDIERNYDEEFPLCNIMCTDKYGRITNNPSPNSYLKVLALPRPMLHYRYWELTKFSNGGADVILPIPFTKILFDAEALKDSKGHFTVQPAYNGNGKLKTPVYNKKNKSFLYDLVDKEGSATKYKLYCDKKGYEIYYEKEGKDERLMSAGPDENEKFINTCLLPCYPGLTVYEFNYDFVMGVRLFEPKTVAYRILRVLTNFKIGGNLGLGFNLKDSVQEKIITKIIENLMFSDEVVKDCFFSFSNDEFASMLNDAEKKRSEGYAFEETSHTASINAQEVIDILNQFDETASLEEQVEVIQNAFTTLSEAVSVNYEGSLKGDIGLKFVLELIKILGLALLETLISPKMLLLFEVNRRIMGRKNGEDGRLVSLEELIKSLMSLITSIITAIMKKLIADLFELVMKYLKPILAKLISMLTLEQLTVYKELILKIIEACTFSFSFPNKYLDTELDVVQYADIDNVDKPLDNEC